MERMIDKLISEVDNSNLCCSKQVKKKVAL